jgi:glutaconate CoA-transferase subunit B
VDRFGNLNSTVIGSYEHPKVRLPGSGGATEIATECGRFFIVMKHGSRSFVKHLDFLSTLGHGRTGVERKQLGIKTLGPQLLVTDLCVMRPNAETCEMEVASLHPGVTREDVQANTAWTVRFADSLQETLPPTDDELTVLRDLYARSEGSMASGDV